MPPAKEYATPEPTRQEVESLPGLSVLEFGAAWCGYCRRAEPLLAEVLAETPTARHIKIADGSTRRLGRFFGVKLWPTLVLLKDGREFARVVRPISAEDIRTAIQRERVWRAPQIPPHPEGDIMGAGSKDGRDKPGHDN